MCVHSGKQVFISFGVALLLGACAHETDSGVGVTTTTAASLTNDDAIGQISKARCNRASECNILGNGRAYADKAQCLDAYRPGGGALPNVAACTNGVDKDRLDKCVAVLVDQRCDTDLGPETAMPECRSYCAR
jgi:hypothetical protein